MQVHTRLHSSALGEWRMSFAAPDAPLADAVALLWDVAGRTHYRHERILPTGTVDVLFNLADDQFLLAEGDPDRRTRFATVWICGLQQRPLLAQSGAYSHLVGLRLTPTGAWRFFGLPLNEITDRVLESDLVLGSSLLSLREQLATLNEPERRLRRVLDFARRRLAHAAAVHPAVAHAVGLLDASNGARAVAGVVAETGYSQKHLIRKFEQQVGLAPKRYARLRKFRAALRRLQSGAPVDLADLALDCGYADQAHFNHDFRRFAGATPTEFLARRLPEDVTAAMTGD